MSNSSLKIGDVVKLRIGQSPSLVVVAFIDNVGNLTTSLTEFASLTTFTRAGSSPNFTCHVSLLEYVLEQRNQQVQNISG